MHRRVPSFHVKHRVFASTALHPIGGGGYFGRHRNQSPSATVSVSLEFMVAMRAQGLGMRQTLAKQISTPPTGHKAAPANAPHSAHCWTSESDLRSWPDGLTCLKIQHGSRGKTDWCDRREERDELDAPPGAGLT